MKTKWILFLVIISLNCFGQGKKSAYVFDSITFEKLNEDSLYNGMYSSIPNAINHIKTVSDSFVLTKKLDSVIFDDKYELYTLKANKYFTREVIEGNPIIVINDTLFYYYVFDSKKNEAYYCKIRQDIPYQTINVLAPVSYYRRRKNYGLPEADLVNSYIDPKKVKAIDIDFDFTPKKYYFKEYLYFDCEYRFSQWGTDLGEYCLMTLIFTPANYLIYDASYITVLKLTKQKPLIKAQVDEREMVDVGDGMKMPKYKYTRTTVFKLIDKLNDAILYEEDENDKDE
jgi:hypothetical protein